MERERECVFVCVLFWKYCILLPPPKKGCRTSQFFQSQHSHGKWDVVFLFFFFFRRFGHLCVCVCVLIRLHRIDILLPIITVIVNWWWRFAMFQK